MRYCEHRDTLMRHGRIELVPVDELEGLRGFRSVYEFNEDIAKEIQQRNSTAGLRGVPVYSDTLFLDFDDAATAATKFKELLIDKNYAYDEYTSGNRSVHFHVYIEPMEGPNVPYYQKSWVKKHAPNADISFYHPAGIYRLPLTFHSKRPGFRKQLLSSRGGDRLKIPTDIPVPKRPVYNPGESSTKSLTIFMDMLYKPQAEGNRTPYMCKLLGCARLAGLTGEQALDYILMWNSDHAKPAHPEEYVKRWFDRTWNGQVTSPLISSVNG
jgi:hypothetical protein